MRFSSTNAALAALVAAGVSDAQYLINQLSFGHNGRYASPIAVLGYP
jgi:hypothetical protein